MEALHGGYTLELSAGAFPLSTDSIALADFMRMPKKATVLDLGSGCGTLGLLLCADHPTCLVTGIELDSQAHEMAKKNARDNHIEDRLTSICADIRSISSYIKAGSFSCCISNPPYFSGGPKSQSVPLARRDDLCNMDDLMAAAEWSLQYGGDFYLVHRPERLAQLCACAAKHNLEPKRLCLLRHKQDGPVALILVQCRKGGKPGLIWEEVHLYDVSGSPTEYYQRLYHI